MGRELRAEHDIVAESRLAPLDGKHVEDDTPKTKKPAGQSPAALRAKTSEPEITPKTSYPLEAGRKVIIPQHGSKAANLEAKRRDEATYGKENTLLDPKDCTGTIVKNVKHGTKKFRDECHELKAA